FNGILQPGEVLLVPTDDVTGRGAPRMHTVRAGETLRAIAADELGDERRWPELLVGGVPVRQALPNPDLITPGLRLTVPGEAAPARSRSASPRRSRSSAPPPVRALAARTPPRPRCRRAPGRGWGRHPRAPPPPRRASTHPLRARRSRPRRRPRPPRRPPCRPA